jgi:hypothetical protein
LIRYHYQPEYMVLMGADWKLICQSTAAFVAIATHWEAS